MEFFSSSFKDEQVNIVPLYTFYHDHICGTITIPQATDYEAGQFKDKRKNYTEKMLHIEICCKLSRLP